MFELKKKASRLGPHNAIMSAVTFGNKVDPADFPEFEPERVYMARFQPGQDLDRLGLGKWQAIVDKMIDGFEGEQEAYLMIDRSVVGKKKTQRRPGWHVDGNWNARAKSHVPPARPIGHVHNNYKPEAVIMLSDEIPPAAAVGTVRGRPDGQGSVEHLDLSNCHKYSLPANEVAIGNATFIHRACRAFEETERTLVRINLGS